MISYINSVQHSGFVLRSMDVDIDQEEMAMTVLNGVLIQFQISSQCWTPLGMITRGLTQILIFVAYCKGRGGRNCDLRVDTMSNLYSGHVEPMEILPSAQKPAPFGNGEAR